MMNDYENSILYSILQLSSIPPEEEPLNLCVRQVQELPKVERSNGSNIFPIGYMEMPFEWNCNSDKKVRNSVVSTLNERFANTPVANEPVPPLAVPLNMNGKTIPTLLITSSKPNYVPPLLFCPNYPKNTAITKDRYGNVDTIFQEKCIQPKISGPTPSTSAIVLASEPAESKNLFADQMKTFPNTPCNLKFGESSTSSSRKKSRIPEIVKSSGKIYNPRDIKLPCLKDKKKTRPFLLYPNDPMELTANLNLPSCIKNLNSDLVYYQYRNEMLGSIQNTYVKTTSLDISNKYTCDDSMLKRLQHNMASQRFRNKRRLKEDELAVRTAFLEIENIKLRYHILTCKHELRREKLSKLNNP